MEWPKANFTTEDTEFMEKGADSVTSVVGSLDACGGL